MLDMSAFDERDGVLCADIKQQVREVPSASGRRVRDGLWALGGAHTNWLPFPSSSKFSLSVSPGKYSVASGSCAGSTPKESTSMCVRTKKACEMRGEVPAHHYDAVGLDR